MKQYLIILCLAASYIPATSFAEDASPASPSQVRESIEQGTADPSLSANEQATQDKQDEKPQIVATQKKKTPEAVPYVNGGYFGSSE